jgi:hypothetical protein
MVPKKLIKHNFIQNFWETFKITYEVLAGDPDDLYLDGELVEDVAWTPSGPYWTTHFVVEQGLHTIDADTAQFAVYFYASSGQAWGAYGYGLLHLGWHSVSIYTDNWKWWSLDAY